MCRARQSLRARVTAESDAFQPFLAASVALTMSRRSLASTLTGANPASSTTADLSSATQSGPIPELNSAPQEGSLGRLLTDARLGITGDPRILIHLER